MTDAVSSDDPPMRFPVRNRLSLSFWAPLKSANIWLTTALPWGLVWLDTNAGWQSWAAAASLSLLNPVLFLVRLKHQHATRLSLYVQSGQFVVVWRPPADRSRERLGLAIIIAMTVACLLLLVWQVMAGHFALALTLYAVWLSVVRFRHVRAFWAVLSDSEPVPVTYTTLGCHVAITPIGRRFWRLRVTPEKGAYPAPPEGVVRGPIDLIIRASDARAQALVVRSQHAVSGAFPVIEVAAAEQ